MTNFGVELFLREFLRLAQSPPGRRALVTTGGVSHISSSSSSSGADSDRDHSSGEGDAGSGDGDSANSDANVVATTSAQESAGAGALQAPQVTIEPSDPAFSGFVFKLQANLDPRHRDRMAFVRICSGVFRKGMKVQHSRLQRSLNLASAQSLFAQDRAEVTVAYPGDVIGIHNPGAFAIGDTIYTGSRKVVFPGIPSFSPEKFAYIRNPNPSTYKKYHKVSEKRVLSIFRKQRMYPWALRRLACVAYTLFCCSAIDVLECLPCVFAGS